MLNFSFSRMPASRHKLARELTMVLAQIQNVCPHGQRLTHHSIT